MHAQQPQTEPKRAKTPPPTSPGARLPGSVRPHKALTEKVGHSSRLADGRWVRADAESATPAAGIILLREKPAISELDDAAWEPQELEVLIGRYEVVNALRSGRDRLVALRYPGEWHFPGGAKRQADRGPLQTACRELDEEFLGGVRGNISESTGGENAPELAATLFTKVSLSLAGRQYVQYVFVADEADNRPLQLTAERINHGLRRQRLAFERLVASGQWWEMARSEKVAVAPEVREVQWLSLSAAIALLDPKLPFVDDWHREELARCDLYWRQIPVDTILLLKELQRLGTIPAIKAASVESQLDRVARQREKAAPLQIPTSLSGGGRSLAPPGLLGPTRLGTQDSILGDEAISAVDPPGPANSGSDDGAISGAAAQEAILGAADGGTSSGHGVGNSSGSNASSTPQPPAPSLLQRFFGRGSDETKEEEGGGSEGEDSERGVNKWAAPHWQQALAQVHLYAYIYIYRHRCICMYVCMYA